MKDTYDLAIIGGGAAGLIAAPFAVQFGARVAFIEKDHIGGEPIGCEIAQGFRRLGSRVTLLEGGDTLLPHDDNEASRILAKVFRNEGIDLRLKSNVERT